MSDWDNRGVDLHLEHMQIMIPKYIRHCNALDQGVPELKLLSHDSACPEEQGPEQQLVGCLEGLKDLGVNTK